MAYHLAANGSVKKEFPQAELQLEQSHDVKLVADNNSDEPVLSRHLSAEGRAAKVAD